LPLEVSEPVDSPPEVALSPDQAPEAVQELAFVEDQVSAEGPPFATDGGFAASDTVGTGGGGGGGAELPLPPLPPPQAERPRPANRAAKMIPQLPLDVTIFPLPINQQA
jgi:hypothetical protein